MRSDQRHRYRCEAVLCSRGVARVCTLRCGVYSPRVHNARLPWSRDVIMKAAKTLEIASISIICDKNIFLVYQEI